MKAVPAGRVCCCVPFCRRTIAAAKLAPHIDWVCQLHWALVPRKLKRAYRADRARCRRIVRRRPIYREYWKLPGGSPQRLRAIAMWRRLDQAWANCKLAAIERAAGI